MTGPVVLVLRLLATAALFAFLGLAMWLLWQELRGGEVAGRVHTPPMRLEIRARSGPVAARSFTHGQVIVGRDPLADLALPDNSISARHARLSYHHGQWWIEDLGSSNGTRLNRVRIETPTVLTSGDEIKCGSTRLTVVLPPIAGEKVQEGLRDE